jgi:hypothetical protein
MDNEKAKGKLVSKEVLQAYLDRQPEHQHRVLAVTDEVTGETKYLEATQTSTQPVEVHKAPEELD